MPPKHVIFLGAGASVSSGYPLANKLALLMADRRTLFDEILQQSRFVGEKWPNEWFHNSTITRFLDSCSPATVALREGAFASMDELGRLSVGGMHSGNVRVLKKLMRFVFTIYNPHLNNLAGTDYRPFVQAMFGASSQIREDVTIISFNYDPYLDYCLRQAFVYRQKVNPHKPQDHAELRNAITSGFEDPGNQNWLERPGFCHLKLHGACVLAGGLDWQRKALPVQPGDDLPPHAADLFHFDTLQGKLATMVSNDFNRHDPPAIMPWEIVHESGRLLTDQEFEAAVGADWQHRHHYGLFSGLWNRARKEVKEAKKLSFVGLSLGPFLEPAFRFLFEGKDHKLECCVANPENERFKGELAAMHPRSPCGKAHALLSKLVSPACQFTRTANDLSLHVPLREQFESTMGEREPEITAYNSFSEFIEMELRQG